MSKLHTHYSNLFVARNAPQSVIKAAYKILVQAHHPDKCSDPQAPKRIQIINAAYENLSDPRKRASHDKWIAENDKTPEAEVKKPEKDSSTELGHLRALHRSDLQQVRQLHEVEVSALKDSMKWQKKFSFTMGVLVAIPLTLIFWSVEQAIDRVHASQQYQEATMKRN